MRHIWNTAAVGSGHAARFRLLARAPFHDVVVMKILSPGAQDTGSISGSVLAPASTVPEMRVHVRPCWYEVCVQSATTDSRQTGSVGLAYQVSGPRRTTLLSID